METDRLEICRQIREQTVKCVASVGVGHLGGSLSLVEILCSLYFKHMNINPHLPQMPGRDRLIVSKGHSGPAVYAALALRGFFPLEELLTLNASGTKLPSHCDMHKTAGIDMTTGSLGQGLSCAVGIALASRLAGDNAVIYAIIGDGESQEGQIWEAALFAGNQKLGKLIAFTDRNQLQIDGAVRDINDLSPLEDKWRSFGWHVSVINGHDLTMIDAAIVEAKSQDKPAMIIANTIKGKGVTFIENKGAANHNMPISKKEAELALAEIRGEA